MLLYFHVNIKYNRVTVSEATKGQDVPMENCKEWLTIREAAEYLGISYGRLSTLINDGVYPVSLVPGFKKEQRLSRTRLDEMLRESEHTKEERQTAEAVRG